MLVQFVQILGSLVIMVHSIWVYEPRDARKSVKCVKTVLLKLNAISTIKSLQLHFSATGCSSERTIAPGTFTSPNYPDDYPNDALCTTLITAPTRRSVILVVQDFMLEFNEPGCPTDSDTLSIYDGNSDEAPLIGVYCYDDIPETISSTAESIYYRIQIRWGNHSQGIWHCLLFLTR